MEEASLKENFEKAGRLRDCIRDIHRIGQSQKMTSFPGEDGDLINIVSEEKNACVVVFLVREGKVIDRKHFLLDIREKSRKEDIITFFLKEYYAKISFIPTKIIIPNEIVELKTIQQWLSQRRGRKVKLEIPRRGDRLKLMQLIKKNAYLILQQETRGDKEEALNQLKEYLELKKRPLLIEGFDISNTRGKKATGSVVVFEKGKPKRSAYRRFRIKTVEGIDDFAMLSEVVCRRYHRSLKERCALPQLILIDGGKGQVSSCTKVIKRLNLNFIPVIGLAKKFEEVYLPGSSLPLNLPPDSIALRLLQEIRDEAHRFAYSYHKKRRREGIRSSFLDTIPGVGEKTKRLLLTHFKSIESIKSKDLKALQQIPGLGEERAKKILEYLVNSH
jgi:excinuclease ABC subunit C